MEKFLLLDFQSGQSAQSGSCSLALGNESWHLCSLAPGLREVTCLVTRQSLEWILRTVLFEPLNGEVGLVKF